MTDEHNRLNSQFNVLGAFWEPETPDVVQTGTVLADEKNISFTTAPEYKHLGLESSPFLGLANRTTGKSVPVLHGFTQDGICTLCDLLVVETPGLTHHELKQHIGSVVYHVPICVTGMKLRGAEDKCLNSARFTYAGLSDWFPKGIMEMWGNEFITLKIPLKDQQILDFSVLENHIRVTVKVFSQFSTSFTEGARMTQSVVFVEIESPAPESLLWFYEVGSRLENLFSLLTGASLGMETFFIYRGEDYAHVNLKRSTQLRAFDPRECVRCISDQLANAIAIWLAAGPAFRSVESLALGVVRKGKLFLETEFLSLAQSLEGVHRVTAHCHGVDRAIFRQVRQKIVSLLKQEKVSQSLMDKICGSISHINEPSFSSRLSDLCKNFSEPLRERIGIDVEQFVKTVVATRNFYTHAGSPMRAAQNKNPLSSRDLFFLSQKMRCLLRGTLLLHLGISERQFSDLLIYEVTRWR